MSKVSQDEDSHWWQGKVRCGLCDHTWTGVVEIPKEYREPIVPMECPECGNMSGHVDDGVATGTG